MASSRRARFIAVFIALAVVALCVSLWVNEGPLWRMVMLETVDYTTPGKFVVRGTVKRWGKYKGNTHGCQVIWHWNGLKARQGETLNGLGDGVVTYWSQDGRIVKQERYVIGRGLVETKKETPWWDGVTDQTEPNDPQWIAERGKQ